MQRGNGIKKTAAIAVLTVLGVLVLLAAASGFLPQTSAYLTDDFVVSEDGRQLTFRVGVASSMGYVRACKDEGGGVKPHYLKFYSTWGGLNSPLGARQEFTLELAPEDTEIYVYHGRGGYELALKKDAASGEWKPVRQL